MGRRKGSLNKSTIARMEAEKTNKPIIDKTGKLLRNGQEVGRIEYEDGLFVAMNLLTRRKASGFELEPVENWLTSQF